MAKTLRTIAMVFLGLLIVTSFYFFGPAKARSASDGVDLHIRIEVSTDNGQTWRNTSGTDYSGGQVAYICQNDSFLLRTRIWNSGTQRAYQVTGLSDVANNAEDPNSGEAIITSTQTNDEDGDGVVFDRLAFTNNGAIYVNTVAPNGSYDDGYQGSIITVEAPRVCPAPGTETFWTANLQGYALNTGGGQQQQGILPDFLRQGILSALANEITNRSEVTIIPCNCGAAGASDDQTAGNTSTQTLRELPQTGPDLE